MRLLLTGAWPQAAAQLPALEAMGHRPVLLPQERDPLPCDPAEIEGVMRRLAGKYSPNEGEDAFQNEMRSSGALCVLTLEIEHLTGKQGKELLMERKHTT